MPVAWWTSAAQERAEDAAELYEFEAEAPPVGRGTNGEFLFLNPEGEYIMRDKDGTEYVYNGEVTFVQQEFSFSSDDKAAERIRTLQNDMRVGLQVASKTDRLTVISVTP